MSQATICDRCDEVIEGTYAEVQEIWVPRNGERKPSVITTIARTARASCPSTYCTTLAAGMARAVGTSLSGGTVFASSGGI